MSPKVACVRCGQEILNVVAAGFDRRPGHEWEHVDAPWLDDDHQATSDEDDWDGTREGDPYLHDVLNRALDRIEDGGPR